MTVSVDGEQFTRDPIARDAFGSLLDELVRAHGTALRVDVHEADGSNYLDLLTPPDRIETEPKPPPIGAAVLAGKSPLPKSPATDSYPAKKAFAPIFIDSSARSDGTVHSLIGVSDNVREVLVLGLVSGTIHVVKVPQ